VIAAVAVLLIALALAWRYTSLSEIATAENILALTRGVRSRWWAPLALIGAYTVGACVLFPRPVLTLASVVAFGVWPGLGYAIAGVLVAALVTYGMGRMLSRRTVRRIAGDRLDAAARPVKHHGIVAVFAANMLPAPPFAVQNMIAGAIRVPLWQFLLGTFLSLMPGAVAWAVIGDQINAALEETENINYWIVVAAVVLFAAFAWFARRWALRTNTG
jgi:uncharacterized membrane protein YdjX (TVP38/TMEM64 family)